MQKDLFLRMLITGRIYCLSIKLVNEPLAKLRKKIVFQGISEPVYRIILPFLEAEIHHFLWSCLAWYSPYFHFNLGKPLIQCSNGLFKRLELIWNDLVPSKNSLSLLILPNG